MKRMCIPFLLVLCASSFVAGQSRVRRPTPAPGANYQATVNDNEAVFTFPISPTVKYEWCPGGLQYSWTIKINSNNQDFELGYFMFTAMGASPCGQGNIRKLLREGQFSLFRQSGESGSLITGVTEEGRFATYEDNFSDDFLAEKTVVSGFVSGNKLIIKVSGAKTLQLLFANRPQYITFESQILEKKRSTTVPVTYTANYLSAINSSPQGRPTNSQAPACLTVNEAKDLINELIPNEPIRYRLSEAVTYKPITSIAEVRQWYPVTYLFYQKGFLRMEDNGYVFHFITSKGQNLNAQYPDGFPIATKVLISVNKVSCRGKKLRIEAAYKINPTQSAIDSLGREIYAVKPFNQPWKVGVEFTYQNGKWNLQENFYLSPVID